MNEMTDTCGDENAKEIVSKPEQKDAFRVFGKQLFLGAHDFDPEQQWKPSSLMRKLQELGTGQCDALGYGEDWMVEQGFFWVLVRMRIHLERNPAIGNIYGETWHPGFRGALWRRDYQLSTLGGEHLGGAVAFWVLLDRSTRSLLRPHAFPQDFPTVPERQVLSLVPQKLAVQEMPLLTTRRVTYADLDANGHANNSRYAEWICDALPRELLRCNRVSGLQIDYRNEALWGDEVYVHGQPEGGDDAVWRFAAWIGEKLCFVAEMELKAMEN